MAQWLDEEACDGFNVMFSSLPEGLDQFVDLVVPELQRRGSYKTAYDDGTLRENWHRAELVRNACDVIVAVLTQQKYNDAAVRDFFAAAAEDGGGVAGGEEFLPLAEKHDAEVFGAGGERGGPALGAVVFDERGGEGAGIRLDGAGEVPLEEAVAGRLVEALVGEPGEGEEGEGECGGQELRAKS
jgi:hypothetical protein